MPQLRSLSAEEVEQHSPNLASLLLDCVEGGASVSFMADLTLGEAIDFYREAGRQVIAGNRKVLAAFQEGELVGSVQLALNMPPNQPHRAEVAKLLVLRKARGKGVARRLMDKVESVAEEVGKTLLVLDTVTGSPAERLYESLGWVKVGCIPNYALFPDGRLCSTTVFYKQLRRVGYSS